MRGPNYWSNYRKKLIVMKLDLEDLEEYPTNKIDGFNERIKKLIPSLVNHRCSEGSRGGFFKRLDEGTWMGHVIEHIALEIQTLAGMECGYGRTRSANQKGVYHVVFAYLEEKAGLYAASAAIRIAEALIKGEPYNLGNDIKKLEHIRDRESLGPSTLSIVKEAEKRKIPCKRLNESSLVMLGYGVHQKLIRATISSTTSNIGVDIASNKEETKQILSKAFIPVPKGLLIWDEEELINAIDTIGFPMVIKPVNGNQGRGVTTNINNLERATEAFHLAKKISNAVIVEQYIRGNDYRFLVINYKLIAVARRTPAMVTGDGHSTIQQLVDEVNRDPNRGDGHERILTRIKIDEASNRILAERKLSLNSVLSKGEVLYLKNTANLSTGGTAHDVTDLVHPYNILLAERIARLMNLDICGIDITADDINIPLTDKTGAVLEVNASPGFRMHLFPIKGLARNVAEPVIDMLFPDEKKSRIPIVAVTGTNGKTTTTRLIAHLAKTAGRKTGYTTTEGIYIQDKVIHYGDCTGPLSSEAVLMDPTVDFAVLECARGGILKAGLGFDYCNVGIVTNISEDHLGLKDIDSVEEMAKVKMVVPRNVSPEGYAILNADDDLVYEMHKELECNIALFSLDAANKRVQKHCENGGLAAIVENGYITICKGEWKSRVAKVVDIPLTFSGKAELMIANILPAVLAGVASDFSIEDIKNALKSFIPSPECTPGRMNLFHFQSFDIMIDYAHNPACYKELKKYLDQVEATSKVGIITAVGDRRDEDITRIGTLSAQTFDEIIIRYDRDLRGKTPDELSDLLLKGIHEVNLDFPVWIIPEEKDAIRHAMKTAKKGSLIVTCTDEVMEIIDFVTEEKSKEEKQLLQPEVITT